jgi:hypothetical protein
MPQYTIEGWQALESKDEVAKEKDYEPLHADPDPEKLWQAIE